MHNTGYMSMSNSSSEHNLSNYYPVTYNNSYNNAVSALDQANPDYRGFYDVAQFITGLILYPVICLVGISGNILTLIVLGHPKMLTSTSVFLGALAVADLIKLLNDTLYFIVCILMRTNFIAGNRMMGYMYPSSHYIFNASVCVASWLTVCIGIERYLYVCHATRVRDWCTVRRAQIVSALVAIVMTLIAIPSALRYKRVPIYDPRLNMTIFKIDLTKLGNNHHFMTWYTWTINLLRSVIPLCLLVVLNMCIILSLRRQKIHGKISGKKSITFMLVIVIIVFLVCITPDAIMSTVFGYGYVEGDYLVKGIREYTDALLATNSAVNFTIYCLCSHNFRKTFRLIFCESAARRRWFYLRRSLHYRDSTTYDGTWATVERGNMPLDGRSLPQSHAYNH